MPSQLRLRGPVRRLVLAASAVSIGAGGALLAPLGTTSEAAAAPEATFVVTSGADDGSPGTLRWAMTSANASPGEDLIEIEAVGTITLTASLPTIEESVTIQGPGMDLATIDGDGHAMFDMDAPEGSPRFIDVADVTLSGAAPQWGGLLHKVHGNATFDRVRISDNAGAPSIVSWMGGILTIRDSVVTGNSGTVVHSDHGTTPQHTTSDEAYTNRTYISDTTFTDNTGGCVVYTERFVDVVDSTFTDNGDSALCVRGLNRSYVRSTTIARNAGHGIEMSSWGDVEDEDGNPVVIEQNAVEVDDVLVYDNDGPGLVVDFWGVEAPIVSDELVISNSVVFGNLGDDVVGTFQSSSLVDNVIGIPRPPLSVTAATGTHAGEIDVSWEEPSFDSGSPVTGYTVTASPGGSTCTAVTTSCTLTGLTPGTSHTVVAVATNDRGDSWGASAAAAVLSGDIVTPTTVPSTTVPPTTVPSTTAPPTTVPSTTAPPTTAPVSRPSVTVPSAPGDPTPQVLEALPSGLDAPSEVRPGQTVTVAGQGFIPGETVKVIMMSDPVVLAEVVADGDGAAVASVTIPLGTTAGEHHLYMYGTTSRIGYGAPTRVTGDVAPPATTDGPPSALAFTGDTSAPLVVLGFVLVALGLSAQYVERRRATR